MEEIFNKLMEIEYLYGIVPSEVLEEEKNKLNKILKGMVS